MKSSTTFFAVLLLAGCASYEPPMPGRHRSPGEAQAETTCLYETPTATRFMALRCRNTEDMKRMAEQARDAADSIRTNPPEIK